MYGMNCSVCGEEMVEQDTNHPAFFLLPGVIKVVACPKTRVRDAGCHDVRVTQAVEGASQMDVVGFCEPSLEEVVAAMNSPHRECDII